MLINFLLLNYLFLKLNLLNSKSLGKNGNETYNPLFHKL